MRYGYDASKSTDLDEFASCLPYVFFLPIVVGTLVMFLYTHPNATNR